MKVFRKSSILFFAFVLLFTGLVACSSNNNTVKENGNSEKTNESANSEKKVMKWFVARGVNNPHVQSVKEIADEYSKINPNFELVIEGISDRPSYLQKLRTLIAGNEMPDMFDTDPDAYAAKLVELGHLVDMKKVLQNIGKYEEFHPIALQYQEFADGSMYSLPLEYGIEVFWYNKKMFADLGIKIPSTFDEFMQVSETLKNNKITPMAVDGKDNWPLLRYMAFKPFRLTGNEFIETVKKGEASFTDEAGMAGINMLYEMGQKGFFQEGFSSTDYTAARDLFLAGKAAIYYMGSWETMNFANENVSDEMKDNIGFFRLPMMEGATTSPNDYFINSGIGLAFNAQTFDDESLEFLKYLLEHYPEVYTKKGQFSPFKYELGTDVEMPAIFDAILEEMGKSGTVFAVPWDTRLDPATNEFIGKEIHMLLLNATTPEEFAKNMDAAIKENAPKYFK